MVGQQAGLGQRQQGQQGGRRIAARVRQQPRAADGLGLELGEPVGHALGQHTRGRVPAGARRVVPQAEGPRQVDNAAAGVEQGRGNLGRRRLGQGQEHDVAGRGERRHVERDDIAVPHTRQRGQATRRGGRRRSGGVRQHELRVARQQPDELLAGVAGGTGESGSDTRGRRGHGKGIIFTAIPSLSIESRDAGNAFVCILIQRTAYP